ncbi:MAG: hypothetical protein H6623_00155 [Bdellovibrionaceae bacterium]|nr:hypothetical protein [Pseudobdellovibrionaceae bacterium]
MFIVLFLTHVWAASIAVQAPTADTYEYQVYAENHNVQRPSEIVSPCRERSILQTLSAKSSDLFLNGSMEDARTHFKKITDLKWKCDWSKEDRALIHHAFLRLAQTSIAEAKEWVFAAVHFDATLPIDSNVFPPPLVSLYKEKQRALNGLHLPPSTTWQPYVKILRNGESIIDRVPTGKARFTFLSDSHEAVSMIMEGEELLHTLPSSTPFVQGDCKNFILNKSNKWHDSVEIFFDSTCVTMQPQGQLLAQTSLIAPQNAIDQQFMFDASPKKKTWLERNYLWVGAAVVGAIVLSIEMNQRKEQTVTTPSHTIERH